MTSLSLVPALASLPVNRKNCSVEDFFREVLSTYHSVLDFCSHYLHSWCWDAVTQCKWGKKWFTQTALHSSTKTGMEWAFNYCFSAMGQWHELLKILADHRDLWTCHLQSQLSGLSSLSGLALLHNLCDVTILKVERRVEQNSWTEKDETNLIWWLVNQTHKLQPVCQHGRLYKALSQKFLLLSEPTDFADSRNKNPNLS